MKELEEDGLSVMPCFSGIDDFMQEVKFLCEQENIWVKILNKNGYHYFYFPANPQLKIYVNYQSAQHPGFGAVYNEHNIDTVSFSLW